MTKVNHDARAVHFLDNVSAKVANAAMSSRPACAVADVVVAVVTKRNVRYATLSEVSHVCQVVLNGQPVLYSQHNTLLSCCLVGVKLLWGSSQSHVLTVLGNDVFNLIEDEIGVISRSCHVESHLLAERFAGLRLWQIGHHCCGILPSFAHLMQVYEYAWVALVEPNVKRKEHRRVAMRVERKHLGMQTLSFGKDFGLPNEPLKERQTLLFHPFGMPLHAK